MLGKNPILIVTSVLLLSACSGVKKLPVKAPVAEQTQAVETSLPEEKKTEFEYLFIEGLKQKKLGNPKNAVTLFSKCLEIDPGSASAMFELANVNLANGDPTSASLLIEKAIQINPNNKWYKILLAQVYQQGKQYEKAADLYGKLFDMAPDDENSYEYLFMKAQMLASVKKYDEAMAAFDKLESKIGFNEQIVVARQQVWESAGKIDKAAAEINRLIEFNPEESQYYGLMADMYQEHGDSVKALEYYNKILTIDPDNGFVQFSLAGYYQKIKDYQTAYEHTRLGFKNDKLELDTKLQMFLMLSSDTTNTIISEKQVTELLGILRAKYSEDYRVTALYADFLLQHKQLAEGREQLRKVLKTNGNDYPIWERLVLIDNDLSDWTSLYDDAKKAIDVFPNIPLFYALQAVACLQSDRYKEALTILASGEAYVADNQAIKIQFEVYKAEANYKLNNVEAAFKSFDEVLKIDPENYLVLNNYAYYLSVRNENLDKAARMSSKAVQANPDNSTYLDTYAWILFMQKDYKLARFYMESALSNGGDQNAVIMEHYGDILYMLDEKDKAREYWLKAQKKGEGSEFLNEKVKKGIYIDK